jgi:hypothetical protein
MQPIRPRIFRTTHDMFACVQQSRASPQLSICSKPHMPSKLVAATNVPDKDINKPPTRVILWPSVIDSFDRGGVERRHAAGNAREPGGSVKWGAPKAEIRNAATTTSRAWVATKWSAGVYRPAIISTRNETSARPAPLAARLLLPQPGSCGTLAAIRRASSLLNSFVSDRRSASCAK